MPAEIGSSFGPRECGRSGRCPTTAGCEEPLAAGAMYAGAEGALGTAIDSEAGRSLIEMGRVPFDGVDVSARGGVTTLMACSAACILASSACAFDASDVPVDWTSLNCCMYSGTGVVVVAKGTAAIKFEMAWACSSRT